MTILHPCNFSHANGVVCLESLVQIFVQLADACFVFSLELVYTLIIFCNLIIVVGDFLIIIGDLIVVIRNPFVVF